MKKICFSFNHLTYSDGVAQSAIAMANYLADTGMVEVTLRPIFNFDKSILKDIKKKVKVKPVLGFYFRGLSTILNLVPAFLLHDWIFGRDRYQIEIGFQYGLATCAVVSSNSVKSKHYVWMHGYDEGLHLKEYYKKADRVVCVSKQNADRLFKELQCAVPVEYCYNPIDNNVVCKLGEEKIDLAIPKELLFISVGRHSEEKGYLRLLKIVERLMNEGYTFKLWLIGDGPQHGELVKYSQEHGLEKVVVFIGAQKNPHKFTSKADLFVCSSYAEGFSTACSEAIMLGVPVLTTSVSGGKEIIDTAKSGMLVGMSDEDLYEGMKYVIENQKQVEEWKERLVHTKHKFSASERISRLLAVLELSKNG